MALVVVGVFITLAVAEVFHQFRGSIAQMEWYRQVARALHLFQGGTNAHIGGIALRAGGEIDRCLRQGDASFGPANLHHGIERRIGDEQGIRVGQAYVLGCGDDQTAGDELRLLPPFNHAG